MFDIEALTQWAAQLEPLSPTVLKLAALVDDPRAETRHVVEVVMLDQVLTARVLRLANSAFSAVPAQITSINDAVVRIGYGGVLGLALGEQCQGKLFAKLRRPEATEEVWRHSVTTAVAAKELASAAGIQGMPHQAFAAALLHDLGRAVFDDFLTLEQAKALADAELHGGLRRHEAELELYAVDHADIGARIVERWGLPESLVRAIRHHHAPEKVSCKVCDLVCLANATAHWLDGDPERGLYPEEVGGLKRLGVEMPVFETAFFRTGRKVVQVLQAYGINPEAPKRGSQRRPLPPALA